MTDRHDKSDLAHSSKAHRIFLILQDDIARGRVRPGEALPGELRLADTHGVSRVTIRRALDALEADGLVVRRAGSGTIVRRSPADGVSLSGDMASLMPQLVEMGQKTAARLLDFSYTEASAQAVDALGLAAGARVQRAVRVRMIENKPFSHLTTEVPEPIALRYSEADLATTPLLLLMERGGVRIARAHQNVSATLAAPDVASTLDVPVGAPLIALTRAVLDEDGQGVEHLSALYRPDRFRLEMTLERVGAGDRRHWEPHVATKEAAE